MTQGFYTGINGIKSASFGIDVLANNISNVNTVGFKSANTGFEDVFYQSVAQRVPDGSQVGFGSVEATSKDVFEQGSLQATDNNFDIAISGKGFFGVSSSDGVYYTRNGAFKQDSAGYLVDSFGNHVLGTMNPSIKEITLDERVSKIFGAQGGKDITKAITADPGKDFSVADIGVQEPIFAPKDLFIPAQPTKNVTWAGQLNTLSKTQVSKTPVDTKDFTFSVDKDGLVSISGSVESQNLYNVKPGDKIYFNITDKNGATQTFDATLDDKLAFSAKGLQLSKVDPASAKLESSFIPVEKEVGDKTHIGAWLVNKDGSRNKLDITLDRVLPQKGDDMEFDATANIYDEKGDLVSKKPTTGTITFNKAGALLKNTLKSVDNNGVSVSLNLGSTYDPKVPNSGFDGLHAFPDKKQNISTKTDGKAEGFFDEYSVNTNGTLLAVFSNGDQIPIAKLGLFNFTNEQGLGKLGNNVYEATSNSGAPTFILSDKGNFSMGSFHGSTLEMSSVDLSVELTNLIVTQKSFDASSKSVTTADQMIQKAINMKK